jgi:hypothetical protein
MPQQILTIVCQLNPTAEQIVKLDQVLQGFAEACRYINSTICPSITNKNRIQKEVYRAVRQQFGLTANLAVRACARVAANRKVGKVKEFRATPVDYAFTFHSASHVRLWTAQEFSGYESVGVSISVQAMVV